MLAALPLTPLPAAPVPEERAALRTLVLGLLLPGPLLEFEFFSSGLGVSWILFLLAADQEVILLILPCSVFLFTKDFSCALSVR